MKRNNYYDDKVSKKAKIDFEDIWGNEDDEFLLMATQAAEKQVETNYSLTNSSILPSYTNFIGKDIISSTQAIPGTSKIPENLKQDNKFVLPHSRNSKQVQDLEEKFKKLQTLCESKEGEVTILRTQLKQCKEYSHSELVKKEESFNEKLVSTKKELNAVTSDLDFKNLEIANLKRKLLTVSKQVDAFKVTSVTQNTPEILLNSPKLEIYSVTYKDNPLQKVVPTSIFSKLCKPPYFSLDPSIQLLKCDGPYLPISLPGDLQTLITKLHPKSTKLDNGGILEIGYIFPEISSLINFDQYSLASNLATRHIKKILSVAIELVYNLHQDLSGFQDCIQKEHIRQFEMQYISSKEKFSTDDFSIFDAKNWVENESGVQCRQGIGLLAEILPHNGLLTKYFNGISQLTYNEEENYYNYFSFIKDKDNNYRNGVDFLNLILSVVTIIGNLRKSSKFCGFLSSISYFLSKICLNSYELPIPVYNVISKITHQLVFSRPNYIVCCYLSSYFQNTALHVPILQSLCKKSSSGSTRRSNEKIMVTISEETCTFQIFSLLYRQLVFDNESYHTYKSHLNIIRFISKTSGVDWLYWEEKKRCDCLLELNKLTIKIVSTTMDKIFDVDDQPQNITDLQKTIIRLSIKVIPKLHLKSLHLIEKDVIFFAQYKVMKNRFLELRDKIDFDKYDIEEMKKLSVDEELPQVSQ